MSRKHLQLCLLMLLLLVVGLLAACTNPEDQPTPIPGASVPEVDTGTPAAAPLPAISQAPVSIRIENSVRPAIDSACLQPAATAFELRHGTLPPTGLLPGHNYLFCAVGADEGATVDFTLLGPQGISRQYTSVSLAQDGSTVAPLTIRFGPDDTPGEWVLSAQSGDLSAQAEFRVQATAQPYMSLTQAVRSDPAIIQVGVGGLAPNGSARFALYSLTSAGADQPNISEAVLLISTRLAADDMGRADLELDVQDLPAGPYMLLLLPAETSLGTPPMLKLPDQENLVLAVNITRPQSEVAETAPPPGEGETAPSGAPLVSSDEAVPPEPEPVPAGGGLPPAISVRLPSATLPTCAPSETPQLRLWPSAGEVGQWWHGCASGFAPGDVVQFDVRQANGETATFFISIGDDGTAPFRWYSAPGEGAGDYRINAQGASGQASLTFTIQPTSAPHVLVFPHDYDINIGGKLNLAGFPANSTVDLGLYLLDNDGNGIRIKQWQVSTNKWGAYKADFTQAFGLENGHYAVVAQGGPAFQFSGVDLAASAIDFFSYNIDPNPAREFYTLYLGRTEGSVVAATGPEPTATPVPEPTPSPTAEAPGPATPATTPTPAEIPPLSVSLPLDASAPPTCPDAQADQPAICLLPQILPRGTFAAMLMHGFSAQTSFRVAITPPNGVRMLFNAKADQQGFADFYWYALNDEKLGDYKVNIRGGGQTFKGTFTVVKPSAPHVVVQPRSPQAGTPVIISVAGFEPREELLIVRYRQSGEADGQVQFERMDVNNMKTGGIGGGQQLFRTRNNQKGQLFLVQIYRPGQPEVLAQAVYQVGKPLKMRYPLSWGQNFSEGQ